MDHLRSFYDVMLAAKMAPPPWEMWRAALGQNFELWPMTDQRRGGQLFGGVLFVGQTIHIAIHPDYHGRWLSKHLLKAYRTWTHPCEIVATPPHDNRAARLLALKLGFKKRCRQGQFTMYVKEPTPCPQQ